MQSNTTSNKLHKLPAGCQSACRYHQRSSKAVEADATRSDLQWEISYQNSPMAELAAFAASCLVDLLLLASLKFSPMSVSAPAAFIQACEGKSHTLITLFDLFFSLSRQSMKSVVCQMHQ